jgi:hypothetical protein
MLQQESLQVQLQLQRQEEQEQEITVITDIVGDESLQPKEEEYIAFRNLGNDDSSTSDSSSDSSESGLYDSDHDYSWHGRYRR